MPRIIGVNIPDNKRVEISLTYLFGIGRNLSKKIVIQLNLDPNMKAKDLTEAKIAELNAVLQAGYVVEGELRRAIQNNIKRLVNIKSYRGARHKAGLPVRGQRTKTNARTRKGKKKRVANKKV